MKQLVVAVAWLGIVAPFLGLLGANARFGLAGQTFQFTSWWWFYLGTLLSSVIMYKVILTARNAKGAFGYGLFYVWVANGMHGVVAYLEGLFTGRQYNGADPLGFVFINVLFLFGLPYVWGGISSMIYWKICRSNVKAPDPTERA